MATFLAKIKINAGKEREFEAIAQTMYEATHRTETSCRRYEYWRGAEPRSYYCLESFDNFLGFIAHQTSDHHEAPDFSTLIESLEIEWLDPLQGASDLVPTQAQEMPADATDLAREYARNFAVAMQNWWQPLR